MATTVTLAPAPIGGGTINPALYESLWMGGRTFLVVFAQTTPNYLGAAVITLGADPYTTGNSQAAVSSNIIGQGVPMDPPRLFRLDANRVLMFWSKTTTADAHWSDQGLFFDATILEISNGIVTVVTTLPNCAPGAFLNYTGNSLGYGAQETTSKAQQYSPATRAGFILGQSGSSAVMLSVDGASTNRLLIAVRNNATSGSNSTTTKSVSLWDVQYVPATTTLTVTKRIATASPTTWGASSQNGPGVGNFDGPNDFPWVYSLPGTTKAVFGFINYDPDNGTFGLSSNADLNVGTYTAASQFPANNSASIVDYTQGGTTWAIAQSVNNMRRASLLYPLDGNRLLEVCGFQCKAGATFTGNFARVYTISNNGFSLDIPIDASTATNNVANGTIAVGLVNQVMQLGNDRLMISVTTQSPVAGTAYMGIYKLSSGTATKLQVTANGVIPLAPLTFQRGGDALVPRAANDPAGSSPYDFYGRTGPLTYSFVRYANPS